VGRDPANVRPTPARLTGSAGTPTAEAVLLMDTLGN
jgi:hypothetical protein